VPAQTPVKDAVRELVQVHNLRHRIHRLKLEGEELAKYGPAKHPDRQGIDQYSEEPVEKGPHYNMDPTGRRTGNGACAPAAWGLAPPCALLDERAGWQGQGPGSAEGRAAPPQRATPRRPRCC
jgi:hypothetical protein